MVKERNARLGVPGPGVGRRSAARAALAAAVSIAVASGAPAMRGSPSVMNDLSSPVDIGDGQCSFGPRLDEAIRGLIVYEGSTPVARAGRVDLAGQQLTASLTTERDESVETAGFLSHDATVQLSRAARWNGLRLTGLRRSTGWHWSGSALEFSDSPARVRSALRAMGIAIPLPPGTRDVPTDECSASIAIEARQQGSALTCSSGC